jgi:hypothetical protein
MTGWMEANGGRDMTDIKVRIERNAMTVSSPTRQETRVEPYLNFIVSL